VRDRSAPYEIFVARAAAARQLQRKTDRRRAGLRHADIDRHHPCRRSHRRGRRPLVAEELHDLAHPIDQRHGVVHPILETGKWKPQRPESLGLIRDESAKIDESIHRSVQRR
jgi:hypothetical protein